MPRFAALAVSGLLWLTACETAEKVSDSFRDRTPRESYRYALEAAGLAETALALDWWRAAEDAKANPVPFELPFVEEAFITPETPGAFAYHLELARGRRLTVEVSMVETDDAEPARLFVELLRIPADPSDPLRPVAIADSLPWSFEYEPWRGGEFVILVQPELLRGGRYLVRASHEAQLAFPVAGRGVGSILSFFGASRDAGRRRHHGVDIFAPRGTPVLAASSGMTHRVGDTNLGGKVVWVRDSVRQANVYYAHLDSQLVESGVWVDVGDTIGLVGNTGNARTTPPHLHFGLYRRGNRGDPDRGPVDPLPFLIRPPGRMAAQAGDGQLLGQWVQVTQDMVNLRVGPTGRVSEQLHANAEARVLSISGTSYRVILQDGRTGYVAGSFVGAPPEDVKPAPGTMAP